MSAMTAQRPLLAATAALPWVELAQLPTPVSSHTVEGRTILVKNDGLCGEFYGGNKVRKLEFLLADALSSGFQVVGTVGAAGSNHALATSVYARHLGMRCEVIHFDQPVTEHVQATVRAIASQGAVLHHVGGVAGLPVAIARQRLRWATRAGSDRVYWIPGGGSSAVGCLGYVNAALEFALQAANGECPFPTRIYVAAGTDGTLAGLIVGLALARRPDVEVIGVRVTDAVVSNPAIVRRLVSACVRRLARAGVQVPARFPAWRLEHGQFGPGYGVSTDASKRAVAVAGSELGLRLENTYTGKTFAAMLEDGRAGLSMYWHTLNQRPLAALTVSPLPSLPPAYAAYL